MIPPKPPKPPPPRPPKPPPAAPRRIGRTPSPGSAATREAAARWWTTWRLLRLLRQTDRHRGNCERWASRKSSRKHGARVPRRPGS